MIHIITGDGRGKTTSSVGLSLRAAGHGQNVLFVQFLKDGTSGEISILKSISNIEVQCPSVSYGFTFQMTDNELNETSRECERLIDIAIESDAFMIVLDEIIHAINVGFISQDKIIKLLHKESELIFTGSCAPQWLIDKADYVSEIKKVSHPYDLGVVAREGIEF